MADKLSLLELAQRCDCFPYTRAEAERQFGRLQPLVVEGQVVGLLLPSVVDALHDTPGAIRSAPSDHPLAALQNPIFKASATSVQFSEHYACCESRSAALALLVHYWRDANRFIALRGWRNELYAAYLERSPLSISSAATGYAQTHREVAFTVERAAAPLLGMTTYGVHINIFTRSDNAHNAGEQIYMWIARRSATKPAWPGRLDNAVAGGIAFGDGVIETAIKECMEEASLPHEFASQARMAGTISYIITTERGIAPEVQYVLDLELPETVKLQPNDGEVGAFYHWDMRRVREQLESDAFKPNCGLVIIDFMIRQGLLSADTEPGYCKIIERLHRRLQLEEFLH